MNHSSIRKIWILLLSIVAMLMSSVVSSAPIITLNLSSPSCMQAGEMCFCDDMAVDTNHHHLSDQAQSNPSLHHQCDSHDMAHNCCGSVYMPVLALFSLGGQAPHISSQLALIAMEPVADTSYRQASLYRPPIA